MVRISGGCYVAAIPFYPRFSKQRRRKEYHPWLTSIYQMLFQILRYHPLSVRTCVHPCVRACLCVCIWSAINHSSLDNVITILFNDQFLDCRSQRARIYVDKWHCLILYHSFLLLAWTWGGGRSYICEPWTFCINAKYNQIKVIVFTPWQGPLIVQTLP